MNKRRLSLNTECSALSDEAIIDVWCKGLGGYCGSFCVSKSDVKSVLIWFNGECSSRRFTLRDK